MSFDRASVDRTLVLGRQVVALVQAEQVSFLAASIAYYAFVSVLPLLLLVLALGSLLGGEDLAAGVVAASGEVLSPVGQDLLRDALVTARGRGPATFASAAVLAWSTLKVFRGLDIAFARIYGTPPAANFLTAVRDAAVALASVGLAVVAVAAVATLFARTGAALTGVLGTLALVAVLSAVFFPLYYLLPNREVAVADALPGTVLAAGGWTLLGTAFGLYADLAAGVSVYGVLGAALLLVTWFYVGSLALLAGATLNAVLADAAETGNDKSPPADTTANERP